MNMLSGVNNRINNPFADLINKRQTESTISKTHDVRAKLRRMTNERQSVYDGFSTSKNGNLLINATLDYGKTIRAERQQKKDSLLAIKTIKYQFKSISSKILQAKTSLSARQVVGQAEREILRLKKERMKEDVDTTELDAAIAHAQAMERTAKRKVKHLEQEEMAEASGGNGLIVDEEESDKANKEGADVEEADTEEEKAADKADAYINETDMKNNAESEDISEINELTEEMTDAFVEGMKDIMDEMGLEELNDALSVETGEIEPEDLKMLKIKHRNREMKEIAKADSEYLKAIFDHLEQIKDGAIQQSAIPSAEANPMDFGMTVSFSEPMIDIAL